MQAKSCHRCRRLSIECRRMSRQKLLTALYVAIEFFIPCKVKCLGPHGNQERSSSGPIKVTSRRRKDRAYKQYVGLMHHMTGCIDRWLQLPEIAKLFGLSEDSIKRLAKNHRLPLRRVTPLATPGALESELVAWLKSQPRVGPPVRRKRGAMRKRQ